MSVLVPIALGGCGSSPAGTPAAPGAPVPPMAATQPHVVTIHGQTLTDEYFWLREKTNPEVLDYLKAEDDYAEAIMKPTAALQDTLYREILGHIKQTDETVPYFENGYFYYSRTREGLQYPVHCRRRGALTAAEEIILDENELASGQAFLSIGGRAVSDDGHLLAFTIDTTGYRQYTLRVKDLRTGALLPDQIERVDDIAWATDSRTIFYVTEDPITKRHDRFWRHRVGAGSSDLVYEEKDELFDLECQRSRDKAVIVLDAAAKTSTEVWFLPADRPGDPLTLIAPRRPDHEYDVDHRGNLWYIRTNQDAKNFRIVTAPAANPGPEHWRELVPHRPEVKIEGIDLFAGHAVLSEWENGLQQIEIINLTTGARRRVGYPEPVYAAGLGPNMAFETTTLRYIYQSLVTPVSVFDYDMDTGQSTLQKQTEVPGDFDRTRYASDRLMATAGDGTKIPISIVYRKDVKKDGSAPLLLYGYGSYGASISPTFASSRLPLLDRGVVYAIAHVRGGGEMGEPWREAGRMMKKMNTFTDFIAAADHLIGERYTSTDRLIIQGASAGGLLTGVAINLRPDLFKAVITQVPFVDVINDMLDASLPLTTSEYLEWGNPNSKAEFDYMRQYSPYDNITRQAYPSMLIKTSLNDSQVMYWEGAKFAARLRAMKTDRNPLLLKVNFSAGHGGSSGRYDALHETAFNWAFLLWQVGLGN
ncbi:MAG: S9 family peptidase [Acidobacteriota bacterium]